MGFDNEHDFFLVLGFLCKPERTVDVYWENNDLAGAWAPQGRMVRKVTPEMLPYPLYKDFINSGDRRISNTGFVRKIREEFCFTREEDRGGNGFTLHLFPSSIENVIEKVPQEYRSDFDRGYNWNDEEVQQDKSEEKLEKELQENENKLLENEEELLENLRYSDNGGPIFKTIKVTKKDFSVFELHRKYKSRKQLTLEVDFQRRGVWKTDQKCELIESILMGLPLPIFYLKQLEDTSYVVVDGKQRLTTLFEYMDNDFALKSLKILSFLNGKKFNDLKDELAVYQSQLEDYQVYSHVILPPTPDKIVFDIFDRVNRGGTQLNKQEIRNALYGGLGLDMINKITETEKFKKATRIEPEYDTRMRGPYLVTRFLAFYLVRKKLLKKNGIEYEYNGDADDLMELTLTEMNDSERKVLDDLRELTEKSLQKASDILGGGAFRKELNRSNPINMNIFETTMYFMTLICIHEEGGRTLEENGTIKQNVYNVITSNTFIDSIGDSRDNKVKVSVRFELMEELAKESYR